MSVYTTPKTKKITIDCSKNKTAYDCLESGCEYAEPWEGAFFCHKPKGVRSGKRIVLVENGG